MHKDIMIKVDNVTKTYQLYNSHADRVKETFHPFRKSYYRPFNALTDVSFQIKKGDAFGIIGRNGSGKSTLLQVICGILQPTSGTVKVKGRVAALLELGAGFNPEFTGHENVYINGAILGISQKEMDERFDEIAAFADIGEFMEQPVKTYSSGMYVRLAFAVQACVEPEVLIVDEALSVGDFFFQQKCLRRMRELRKKHVTLVFVSHDMATVRDLCEKTLYLKQGKLIFFGDTQKAVQLYFQEGSTSNYSSKGSKGQDSRTKNALSSDTAEDFNQKAIWVRDEENKSGDPRGSIFSVSIFNSRYEPIMKARISDKIIFGVLYKIFTDEPVHISFTLKNRFDQVINSSGSHISGIEPPRLKHGAYAVFELEMKCMIEAGPYTFAFNMGIIGELPNRGVEISTTPWLGPLVIDWDYEREKAPFLGMFDIPVQCRFNLLGHGNK